MSIQTNLRKLSDYISNISDIDISSLLGLTTDEYRRLICKSIYEYKDQLGMTVEYFLHISPLNGADLLRKLNMDANNIVSFTPKQLLALRRRNNQLAMS